MTIHNTIGDKTVSQQVGGLAVTLHSAGARQPIIRAVCYLTTRVGEGSRSLIGSHK